MFKNQPRSSKLLNTAVCWIAKEQYNIALVAFVVFCLLICAGPAHAATKEMLQAAIGKTVAKGNHPPTVFLETPSKQVFQVEIWEYKSVKCGFSTGMTVAKTKLDSSTSVTSITAYTALDSGVIVVLSDDNADGIVESASYNLLVKTGPDVATQKLYDAVIRCVAED